jgi:hypothetical protein
MNQELEALKASMEAGDFDTAREPANAYEAPAEKAADSGSVAMPYTMPGTSTEA